MPSRNAALYELFKALYYAEQDRVEAERASKGEDTALKSSDVPRCISGKSGAPIEERPFDRVLNRKHILSCVEKVGLSPFNRKSLRTTVSLRRAPGDASSWDADPRAAKLQRVHQSHGNVMTACGGKGLNIAALMPVPERPRKAKKEPTLYSAPRSETDEAMGKVAALKRMSAGPLLTAVGAKPLTSDEVMGGMIERSREVERQKRLNLNAARDAVVRSAATAQETLARGKATEHLISDELKKLISWKLGPRGGLSNLKTLAQRCAKWDDVKDGPSPVIPEDPNTAPLPYEEIYQEIFKRATSAQVTEATEIESQSKTLGRVDVEGLSLGDLEALVAVASAEKLRREWQISLRMEEEAHLLPDEPSAAEPFLKKCGRSGANDAPAS
jgi:hypothetical protein